MKRFRSQFGRCEKRLLTLAGLVAAVVPVILDSAHAAQDQSAPKAASKLSFDVASIRERKPGQHLSGAVGVQILPGRLISQCSSLEPLLYYAYHLSRAIPIEGLPEWGKAPCGDASFKDTFVFEATMPVGTTDQQSRQMMQTLLADRFNLVAHWEKREGRVSALVIRSSGFKLKPYHPNNDVPIAPHSIGCPEDDTACHIIAGATGPISVLASMLTGYVGRPVIDKTGLAGEYDLNLMWAGDTTENSSLPSLPAALREKFGLELKSQTGMVDVLVITHVERPSPN